MEIQTFFYVLQLLLPTVLPRPKQALRPSRARGSFVALGPVAQLCFVFLTSFEARRELHGKKEKGNDPAPNHVPIRVEPHRQTKPTTRNRRGAREEELEPLQSLMRFFVFVPFDRDMCHNLPQTCSVFLPVSFHISAVSEVQHV